MDNTPCATTDSESQVAALVGSSTGPRFSKKVVAAVLAGAAVLLAPVAIHLRQSALTPGSVEWAIQDEQFGAKMDSCSDLTTSCLTSKCCKSTGYKCFQTGKAAMCSLKCPAGSVCQELTPSYTSKPSWAIGNSVYCYTVYVGQPGKDKTDNPKDLAILKFQKSKGLGVFGCDASSVFSDVSVDIGGGASTSVVTPTGDWKKYTRKDKPMKYLNTPLYMGAWKQIKAEGAYASFAWTVKADIPTVFLPNLLKAKLAQYPETPTGTYIESCNKVLMGYFGNLEVASMTGMKRFLEQFESYYSNGGKCWRWEGDECQKKWKYGPWGEDLFMQFTMDSAEVMKKTDFDLTDTGTCPGMRPKADKKNTEFVPSCNDKGMYKFVAVHPLRNVTAWEACYNTFSART